MSGYNDLNAELRSHIKTLRIIIAAFIVLNLIAYGGWIYTQKNLDISIPPDLRFGATVKPGEIPDTEAFLFARNFFQMLYDWPENGVKDYPQRIYELSPKMTPQFIEYLELDMETRASGMGIPGRGGELTNRVRIMKPLVYGYDPYKVDKLDDTTWVIWLDFHIIEFVENREVKNVKLRYPLRVVRWARDKKKNPWGLALDGYAGKIETLKEASEKDNEDNLPKMFGGENYKNSHEK